MHTKSRYMIFWNYSLRSFLLHIIILGVIFCSKIFDIFPSVICPQGCLWTFPLWNIHDVIYCTEWYDVSFKGKEKWIFRKKSFVKTFSIIIIKNEMFSQLHSKTFSWLEKHISLPSVTGNMPSTCNFYVISPGQTPLLYWLIVFV